MLVCVLKALLTMGLQGMGRRRSRCRYQRLRERRRWARKPNGKVFGIRLSPSKRLSWRGFPFLLIPRRLSDLYAEILTSIMALEGAHPTIIFSSQWGLPVLSHPSITCKRSAATLHKNCYFS